MKELLYLPTSKLVHFYNTSGNRETNQEYITAGTYISSGAFKREFPDLFLEYDPEDQYSFLLAIILCKVRSTEYTDEDNEYAIFGDHVYEYLEADRNKLIEPEFEIIEVD